jgi:hypothetical protein
MKKFLYRVGDWLLTVVYFAMHRVFPQGWLTAIAHKVPYKENVYAPGGFFVAPPKLPPETPQCEIGGNPLMTFTKGIPGVVLRLNAHLTGTVVGVESPYDPRVDDWGHNTFYIKPADMDWLNEYSRFVNLSWPGMENTIKCQTPVSMALLPKVGDDIELCGTDFLHLAHGYPVALVRAWRLK